MAKYSNVGLPGRWMFRVSDPLVKLPYYPGLQL
jgi:hypothetical protein